MKQASNITPIEMAEEGAYNILTMTSIAGAMSCFILVCHLLMFHSIFSIAFLVTGSIFLCGVFFFPYMKKKRFSNRDYSLGERVKRIELMMGEVA